MKATETGTRTDRRSNTKGKKAMHKARENYRATHGVPGQGKKVAKTPNAAVMVEVRVDSWPDLESATVDGLRATAKTAGIKGYSKMRKAELVAAIRQHYAATGSA